jgi:hypothetical protein
MSLNQEDHQTRKPELGNNHAKLGKNYPNWGDNYSDWGDWLLTKYRFNKALQDKRCTGWGLADLSPVTGVRNAG